MHKIPAEALAALDASAEAIERLDEAGLEIDFTQPRFSRAGTPVKAVLRDQQGGALQRLTLLEALDLLSA